MKNIKYIFIILTFFNSLNSQASSLFFKEEVAKCYWMENISGKYEWVSTEDYFDMKFSKKDCFILDSCDGGLGVSNGGCYKWAKTANGLRIKWD